MKRLTKILFSIVLLSILSLSLLGCSYFEFSSNNNNNSSDKQNNYIQLGLGAGEQVKIEESTSDYVPSSIEETVGLVYDSVVSITASSNTSTSRGSGVIIGKGEEYYYIITCHHVIDGCSNISISLSDNTTYPAQLVGGDEYTDIAVIKIKATNLTVAKFISDSQNVKIASTAIVIGNPLGTLSGSVTTGVISSTSRLIEMSDGTIRDLIQTDAAINAGNSGGGMFNIYGELIGIVNAKFEATGVEGLGFAIPASTAKSIAIGLIEKGYVAGRYNLGFVFSDGYYRSGGFFGTVTKVVYVSSVDANSSSYGLLEVNDILVSITINYADNTKSIDQLETFSVAQDVTNFFNGLDLSIGDTISFKIRRGSPTSNPITVNVEIKQYIYS